MNREHSKLGRASRLKLISLFLFLAGMGTALLISPARAALGTCGNGVVDKFEQCDDGNLNDGDGCSSLCQKEGDDFPVVAYIADDPPPTPALQDLPLLTKITQHGITWTFASPQRVGRFVNGDYYVVGTATIIDIQPLPTTTNGLHGSMLNIRPNIQRSGFDSRIQSGRYDPSLRVYPPITLAPGNKLVSSRSAAGSNPSSVMRPFDTSVSPVASISILTSVNAPQPMDAFRPSYAQGSTPIYLSRNLRRQLLPKLPSVHHVPPLSEFEGYLKRPWVDSVFFNFDVPAEYMASYGRENAYLMSFAGLLLTLDFSPGQKEPLLVYLTQYGIDLHGLVEQGHTGWQAHGGHGSGRKFPIILAGVMLNEEKMKSVRANFGEDMQTIWVSETLPVGTYTKSWHSKPETVVYGGHVGINGESVNPGWGPYEHLAPSAWKNTLGESYRRCCTSVSWVGEALAVRLIPGVQAAWNHPQFLAYVDRWINTPDDPQDLATIQSATGMAIDPDFMQGQSWKILSGGGYYQPHRTFVDEMWAAYRNLSLDSTPPSPPQNLRGR
jgi:cysteine-rich repeat protein